MATKTINGSYPGGYYLNPSFQTLDVANGAYVGGPGITASSTQPSTIDNSGTVHGGANGITLNDGGTVTNEAGHYIGGCIIISGQAGTVTNNGTLGPSFNGYSVILQAGGSVTNGSPGDPASIDFGIQIPGGGSVTNFGSIGFVTSTAGNTTAGHIANYGYISGMSLGNGSTIINGSASDTTAEIRHPYAILMGQGTVTNYAIIDGFEGIAIHFYTPNARLIEEGSGVIIGSVFGDPWTLELGAEAGPGTLNGLGSTLTNMAAVVVDKGANWSLTGSSTIAAGTTLTNAGALTLGQVINSGDFVNQTASKLIFDTDASITTDPSVKAGAFTNAGLVEKIGGAGTSIIRTGNAALIDNGKIDVATGTLELTGDIVSVEGLINGAGTIEFGAGATTLGFNASVKTGGFTIAGTGAHLTVTHKLGFAGTFSASANTELTIDSGDLLGLTGAAAFTHDTIDGAGELVTGGATTISLATLGGTVTWKNSGGVTETGQFTIGDSNGLGATFLNESTGLFDLAGNVGIAGTAPSSTFVNAGLLAKTAGNATSSITAALDNVGTVAVASGTLALGAAVTGNGGTLQIDNDKILKAGASVSAGQTVLFDGANDRLTLTDAEDFHAKLQGFAVTDKIDLTQFGTGTMLAFSGNATQGTLTVTEGGLEAKLSLLGQYAAAGFQIGTDSHGGSFLTYTPPPGPNLATDHLAAPGA